MDILPPEGQHDLRELLRHMRPEADPRPYVFAVLPEGDGLPGAVVPFATVHEAEGLTAVVLQQDADRLGLAYATTYTKISLHVHSALTAVGLTAAFASRLADAGISCNVLAGYYHDHIFVPSASQAAAMTALRELSAEAAG
jgi:uncharacterized protein